LVAIPFAIAYAIITYFQWHDLRHNFEIDERAWLKVEIGIPESAKIPFASVKTTNIGKSPALQISEFTVVRLQKSDIEPVFAPFEKSAPKAGVRFATVPMLFPGTTNEYPVGLTVNADGSSVIFREEDFHDLITGKTYLLVFGEYIYKDQFGTHWTRACNWKAYFNDPRARFNAGVCVAWDNVGDGEPPK
jgi:hypothetical protein